MAWVFKEKQSKWYIKREDLNKYSEEEYETKFEKMSKSKGNGVSPMTLIEKYGADVLWLAILFAAPPESDIHYEESIVENMS